MDDPFQAENADLRWSWERYDYDHLDAYLVSGVEDPRINCQSILTRAFIADTLWPGRFTDLIDAELRFGVVLTWLLLQTKGGREPNELLDSIAAEQDPACPTVVRETYRWLQEDGCPAPDYLSAALVDSSAGQPAGTFCEPVLDTFCNLWRVALEGQHADRISVVEPACGSANDFRFIDRCGLARFIDYTGFDISPKNIANAKRRFPDVNFLTASVLHCSLPDNAFDYVLVHDLFEHLSEEAMNRALAEVMRLVRREAWLHFFSAERRTEHVIRPVGRYHANLLSIERLIERLAALGGAVEVVSITELLRRKFALDGYYNPRAATLLVTKSP